MSTAEPNPRGHKALAFQEPWATLVATGVKANEYRSRRINTPVRDLVVCASKTASVYEPIPGLCYGKAVGLVDVVGCDPDGEGGWVWRLENARLIEPFDVRASAGFFYVREEPATIPTTEESYRAGVLPLARRGDDDVITDVIDACLGDMEVLLALFGDDIEEWL